MSNPRCILHVDISKVQDAEVGDGTTSVVVLAAELLKEAERLVAMNLHPQTIIAGWRKATDCAREALAASAKDNRWGSVCVCVCVCICVTLSLSLSLSLSPLSACVCLSTSIAIFLYQTLL